MLEKGLAERDADHITVDTHHVGFVRAHVGPVIRGLRVDAELWQGAVGRFWGWVNAPQVRHFWLSLPVASPFGCAYIQEHQEAL